MCAKNRTRRIPQSQFRIVAGLRYDLLRIDAGLVALESAGDLPLSSGIGGQCFRIIGNLRYRRASRDDRPAVLKVRLGEIRAHLLQVVQRTSQSFLWNFKPEAIERLQKDTFCHHESLSDSPVSRLPEVAALSVLEVRFPGEQ